MQFYPPGFPPFADSASCNSTKWCAALTIDSLECTYQFASCNNNCIEPVNFSYLTDQRRANRAAGAAEHRQRDLPAQLPAR